MLDSYRYSSGQFIQSFFVYRLTGEDVGFFLQAQSTYNFKNLKDHEYHLISFLDGSGKVEFYCWALKTSSEVLLLTPLKLADQAHVRLEKFLISEDVKISALGIQDWTIILGPKAYEYSVGTSFQGLLFDEPAILGQNLGQVTQLIPDEDIELWRTLNGSPHFSGEGFVSEIVNNLRLFDLSVSMNKGCYPGQETVSKIATRRGAAFSPVLLETNNLQTPGPLYIFDKKIGEIETCVLWNGVYYSSAKLLRDFRVAGIKLRFMKEDKETDSVVRYYPMLSGSSIEKALELYYAAIDSFKADDYQNTERLLKSSLALNPEFADAYETLGVILGRLDRFPEAIGLMDQLTKIDPSSVLAHTNKSLFLMKMGKIEEAEEQKSLATIKSFQKFGDEAKLKEQILKEKIAQEDEWIKRESMFKQVLEIDDEDTLANYGLGSIAVERKDWLAAVNYLEKVVQADENYSVAYLSLGKAYKGMGEKEKAQNSWKLGIVIAAKKGDLMPANQMQFELQNL